MLAGIFAMWVKTSRQDCFLSNYESHSFISTLLLTERSERELDLFWTRARLLEFFFSV